MKRLALGLAFAAAAAPGSAWADNLDGDIGAISVVVGGALGLTNSVAAVVYLVQDRSFDDGWLVSSAFSTALCAGLTIAAAEDASANPTDDGLPILAVGMAVVALVPAIWAVRSTVDEALPGEPFDPEKRREYRIEKAGELSLRPPVDPFAPRRRASAPSATTLALPALRF